VPLDARVVRRHRLPPEYVPRAVGWSKTHLH
jgi:hypothetical protein